MLCAGRRICAVALHGVGAGIGLVVFELIVVRPHHSKHIVPLGLVLCQGVGLGGAGLPCAGEGGSEHLAVVKGNFHLYIIASERLRNHVEGEVVAGLAHDDVVNSLGGAHVHLTVAAENKGFRVRQICPLCAGAVLIGRQHVASFAFSSCDFHLGDGLVPREVLPYLESHGGEGVSELQVDGRGDKTCGIAHFTRTGGHQVFLINHFRFHLEVNVWCGGSLRRECGLGIRISR